MKKENDSTPSRQGRLSLFKMLTMVAGLVAPVAPAFAQSFYTNSTGDFNVAASWSPTGVPSGNATDDNGSNNVILIQPGDPAWIHGDTLAGQTSGSSGAYLQTGSTNGTGYPGNGNWLRLGIGTGGTEGYYVLSNGTLNVAGRTQLGENGYGYLEIDGGVYTTGYNGNPGIVCGQGDFGVSSGTLVINGGAVTNISNETWFGEALNNCYGYFFMNGGAFQVNNWFVFGRNGGNGFGTMTGGTLTLNGGGQFLVGGGGIGSLAQSGGTINVFNQYLVPQSNGSGSGLGTNILSGTAVLNVHDWLAVGRNNGYGELDISGNAYITRDNNSDGGSHFDIGASAVGIVNQNGGTIKESTSDLYVGESGNGTWNFNNGTALLQNVILCLNNSASGHLNLNGGVFQATSIGSPSYPATLSVLNMNGGTIQANANNTVFINNLYQASIASGGVTFDSQGYNITIPQALTDAGGGTLTKIGSGTLTLSGASSYAGTTAVNVGTLNTTTASTGGGGYTVAGGATLNVQVVGYQNSQLNMSSLSFSSPSTTIGIDVNNFGNPGSAPVNVSGALTASGTVTINVLDELPQLGQFPLIAYGTTNAGLTYVLGSIPVGVTAHLVDDSANNSIDLDITAVNLPHWDGLAGGNWDVGLTTNWLNAGTGTPTYYDQGNAVTFDDTATGTTNVDLVTTVTPGSVTINNSALIYTLYGSGSINGSIGLLKEGTSSFALDNVNGYTGPTTIAGGELIATNLANGGSASSIGASSANPTNLVLENGTLGYTGPSVSINRGYSLDNTNCAIDAEGNLALSGAVTAVADADFTKTGPAQLTYTGAGVNALSGAGSLGYSVVDGTAAFSGPSGGQTNNILGNFVVGGLLGTNGTATLTNTIVNVSSGEVILGQAGGGYGTLNINNGAVLNATSGTFDMGDGAGVISTGVVNQAGGIVNILGPSTFVGQNNNGVGTYNLTGGTLNVNNWLAIGRQGGYGVFNLSGTAVLHKTTGNGNIDIGNSGGVAGYSGTGVLNQTGGSITNTDSQMWLGEGASGEPDSGTWNMSGGTAVVGEVHVGVGGTGTSTLSVSGSASITESYLLLANYDTNTTADVNVGDPLNPGGTINVNADMNVGGQGIGNLNFVPNGGGKVTVTGTLYLSRFAQVADGTVNLNTGGTLIAAYINNGWGFQNNFPTPTNNPNAFNFNGGTLQAYVSSTFFIQPYVNVVVQSGGANINDGGYSVEVQPPLVNGGGGGGLTKLGNGTLQLDGANTYTGTTLVSSGTLAVGPNGGFLGPVSVASGATLGGDAGSIESYSISNSLTLQPGSTTAMSITPTSNDQIFGLTTVSYGGALVVTNNSGSPLTVGHQYTLFNAASSGTGNFASVTILPAGAGTFNPSTGVLTITSSGGSFAFNPVTESGGNLILTGTGGAAGAGYTLLTTTNLATPIANWTTNTTGTLDGTGSFSNSIPVNPSQPAAFFKVRSP